MTIYSGRITDAHVHWWDVEANPWYHYIRNVGQMTGTNLHSNFLPADYRKVIGEAKVAKVVHVSAVPETQHYIDEQRWLDGVGATSGLEVGCVGSVDPALDAQGMRAHLNAQLDIGRLRGIRVLDGLDPDGEAARVLADWLTEHDLVFDLVARPDTLASWTSFVATRPGLGVVLEHSGWPHGLDEASYQAWERALTDFAAGTAAAVKVSGLAMVTFEISEPALRRWIEVCVDRFGWDRVIFASNFPVDGLAGSYQDLLNVFGEVLGHAGEDQLDKFYAANAERIYRI